MEQLEDKIKQLKNNNINFNMWNEIYDKYIQLLLNARLSSQEIQFYSAILLNSFPICTTDAEEQLIKFQKEKITRALELLPNNNPEVIFSDYISQIKKVKAILCENMYFLEKPSKKIMLLSKKYPQYIYPQTY